MRSFQHIDAPKSWNRDWAECIHVEWRFRLGGSANPWAECIQDVRTILPKHWTSGISLRTNWAADLGYAGICGSTTFTLTLYWALFWCCPRGDASQESLNIPYSGIEILVMELLGLHLFFSSLIMERVRWGPRSSTTERRKLYSHRENNGEYSLEFDPQGKLTVGDKVLRFVIRAGTRRGIRRNSQGRQWDIWQEGMAGKV